MSASLPTTSVSGAPVSALAPMQDVTTLPFMGLIDHYGAPDYFVTEYFRVHETSKLEPHILRSITENPSGRPVFAQLIGEDFKSIERTLNDLKPYSCAGIDLNLGCPAPKVYKKCVGGGLLRDLDKLDGLLAFMRERIDGLFTVKTRIGFEDASPFETLLESIKRNRIDLLTIHGRTVKQMYRGEVRYDKIKQAVQSVDCPVVANGNVSSAQVAADVYAETGCFGIMVGRGAIRNPWIFRQIRERFSKGKVYQPLLKDVRDYVERLYRATYRDGMTPRSHLGVLKKFLNFVAQGVDEQGRFQYDMRRAQSPDHLLKLCDHYLLGERSEMAFACEPYEGVIARPNCE